MTEDVIHIPLRREIYNKLLVATRGTFDPYEHAEEGVLRVCAAMIQAGNLEYDEDYIREHSSDLDDLHAEVGHEESRRPTPLIWKEITVPEHSHVRMKYNGLAFEAIVSDGAIKYEDKLYTPAQWANKIADNTNRNAWKDIWFKLPGQRDFVLASQLREAARARLYST